MAHHREAHLVAVEAGQEAALRGRVGRVHPLVALPDRARLGVGVAQRSVPELSRLRKIKGNATSIDILL